MNLVFPSVMLIRRRSPRLYGRVGRIACVIMITTSQLPAAEFEPFFQALSLTNTTGDVTIAQHYNFDRRFPIDIATKYLRFTWADSNHRAQFFSSINDASSSTNRVLQRESGRFQGNVWAFQNGNLMLRGDSSTLGGIYARLGGRTPDEAIFDSFLHRGMDSVTFDSLSIAGNRVTGKHRGGDLALEGTIEHLGSLEYRLSLDLSQVDIKYIYEVGLTNFTDNSYIPAYVIATYIRDGIAVNQEKTSLISLTADIAAESEFDPHVLFSSNASLSKYEIDPEGRVDKLNPDGTRTPIGRTETLHSRRIVWAMMILLFVSPFVVMALQRYAKRHVNKQPKQP